MARKRNPNIGEALARARRTGKKIRGVVTSETEEGQKALQKLAEAVPEELGDVTPYDVYTGRHVAILESRKEAKSTTLKARKDYNMTAREQSKGL